MDKTYHFWLLKLLSISGFLILSVSIVYAFAVGDFSDEVTILTSMPWGVVSLLDLYVGLIIFSCWVLWRESSVKTALPWVVLILVLGNVLSCLYLCKALLDAEGCLTRFFLGSKVT